MIYPVNPHPLRGSRAACEAFPPAALTAGQLPGLRGHPPSSQNLTVCLASAGLQVFEFLAQRPGALAASRGHPAVVRCRGAPGGTALLSLPLQTLQPRPFCSLPGGGAVMSGDPEGCAGLAEPFHWALLFVSVPTSGFPGGAAQPGAAAGGCALAPALGCPAQRASKLKVWRACVNWSTALEPEEVRWESKRSLVVPGPGKCARGGHPAHEEPARR